MSAYPLTPDRTQIITKQYSTIVFGKKHQRDKTRSRNTTGNPRKKWRIFHDHITFTEMTTLKDFFKARRGRWHTFDFTDPATSASFTVRFDTDLLRIQHPTFNLFNITIDLVEVL